MKAYTDRRYVTEYLRGGGGEGRMANDVDGQPGRHTFETFQVEVEV